MSSKNLDEHVASSVLCPLPLQDSPTAACGVGSPKRSHSSSLDQQDEMVEDVKEEVLHQAEKKRRLTSDQVKILEHSFEMENKLEPERKFLIAKQLGLQPRQIAVWFQNRRARWKTKQLERDFEALKASYDAILKENEKLQAEVTSLNAILNTLNGKNCGQAVTFDAPAIHKNTNPVLPAVCGYLDNLEQSLHKEFKLEEFSSKSEIDSPTKSDQSEVLNSDFYLPASRSSIVRLIEDSSVIAAGTIPYSDGLCENMYNPFLHQQVAMKFDGGVFQEESCNLSFNWEDHGLFSWYS